MKSKKYERRLPLTKDEINNYFLGIAGSNKTVIRDYLNVRNALGSLRRDDLVINDMVLFLREKFEWAWDSFPNRDHFLYTMNGLVNVINFENNGYWALAGLREYYNFVNDKLKQPEKYPNAHKDLYHLRTVQEDRYAKLLKRFKSHKGDINKTIFRAIFKDDFDENKYNQSAIRTFSFFTEKTAFDIFADKETPKLMSINFNNQFYPSLKSRLLTRDAIIKYINPDPAKKALHILLNEGLTINNEYENICVNICSPKRDKYKIQNDYNLNVIANVITFALMFDYDVLDRTTPRVYASFRRFTQEMTGVDIGDSVSKSTFSLPVENIDKFNPILKAYVGQQATYKLRTFLSMLQDEYPYRDLNDENAKLFYNAFINALKADLTREYYPKLQENYKVDADLVI